MEDSDIVEVYSALNSQEAHLMRHQLEDAGMEARVVGDLFQESAGIPPGQAAAPRIWVRKEDESRAREIIEELQRKRRDA